MKEERPYLLYSAPYNPHEQHLPIKLRTTKPFDKRAMMKMSKALSFAYPKRPKLRCDKMRLPARWWWCAFDPFCSALLRLAVHSIRNLSIRNASKSCSFAWSADSPTSGKCQGRTIPCVPVSKTSTPSSDWESVLPSHQQQKQQL